MKGTDLAYMAGILDGEGCILIQKKKPTGGKLYVSVPLNDLLTYVGFVDRSYRAKCAVKFIPGEPDMVRFEVMEEVNE